MVSQAALAAAFHRAIFVPSTLPPLAPLPIDRTLSSYFYTASLSFCEPKLSVTALADYKFQMFQLYIIVCTTNTKVDTEEGVGV